MLVAQENMTYKCSHHWSSFMPILPAGSCRAQSMVTPVRIVWPSEAVDVKNFSWVNAKPVRLIVWVSELRHLNSVSIVTLSVLLLKDKVDDCCPLLLHQAQHTIDFDSDALSHAHVRRQHTMDVACTVHVRNIQQSLCCTPVNRIAFVDRLQEHQEQAKLTSIAPAAVTDPSRQRFPMDKP